MVLVIRQLPGENEEKCCWCFPIKCGVFLIGLGIFANALKYIQLILSLLDGYLIYAILFGVATLPMALAAYLFIAFFRDQDNREKRDGLVKACHLVVLSMLIGVAIYVVELLTGATTFALLIAKVVQVAINGLVYLYYAGVCTRYAEKL